MKILACSLTYPLPNGVTSSINESIDGFKQAGHEIHVVSPDYELGQARPEHYSVQASTIGKAFVRLFGKDERMFGWQAGRQIKQIVRQFKPDAFWLHTVTWAPSAFEKVMIDSRLPKVLTYHTTVEMYGKIYGGLLGEQQMIRRSVEIGNAVDHVITPSHFMAGKLINYGVKKPISVIASGIEPIKVGHSKKELAKKYGFSEDQKVLIYVGRVVKEKNIDALVKMMQRLQKIRQDCVLVLVGPGEIDELKAEAEKLGVASKIIFTDQLPLEEARHYYTAADIFVFASQSETQGLVVGEAMSAGVPVVALDSPIRPEVYPKEVAVVVKVERDFAPAVDQLLNNPERYALLKEAGKKFVAENFSKKTMIEKQVSVFDHLLG